METRSLRARLGFTLREIKKGPGFARSLSLELRVD
jgi:hypothetical protein